MKNLGRASKTVLLIRRTLAGAITMLAPQFRERAV